MDTGDDLPYISVGDGSFINEYIEPIYTSEVVNEYTQFDSQPGESWNNPDST
jgi:hypothetical protein